MLQKPITVVQPLPREAYGAKNTCIGEWTFGVPDKLQGVPEALTDLLPNGLPGSWLHDFATLESYFEAQGTPTSKDKPGEGFSPSRPSRQRSRLVRARAGSCDRIERPAQLSAGQRRGVRRLCGSSLLRYSFMDHFNVDLKVDALIASPFSIPATYGIRLAVEFPEALRELTDFRPGAN